MDEKKELINKLNDKVFELNLILYQASRAGIKIEAEIIYYDTSFGKIPIFHHKPE